MKKYIILSCIFFVLLMFSCKTSQSIYEKQKISNSELESSDFLYWAVLDGLIKDKFPKDVAQYIVDNERDYFVPKCPICRPVTRAFLYYAKKSTASKKTHIGDHTIDILKNGEQEKKHTALKNLIDAYVSQEYITLKMDDRNKKRIQNDLESGRKQGMSGMGNGFGTFCPSCDGACEAN